MTAQTAIDWIVLMVSCAGCNSPVEYGGKGRPPKYCANCARKAKTAKDHARPQGGHQPKKYPRCCLEAQAAAVKTTESGTKVVKAKVFVCEQHAQWAAFRRVTAEGAELRTDETIDGFRVSTDDDYLAPDQRLEHTESGSKVGRDTALERAADEWLRLPSHSAEPRSTKAQVTQAA